MKAFMVLLVAVVAHGATVPQEHPEIKPHDQPLASEGHLTDIITGVHPVITKIQPVLPNNSTSNATTSIPANSTTEGPLKAGGQPLTTISPNNSTTTQKDDSKLSRDAKEMDEGQAEAEGKSEPVAEAESQPKAEGKSEAESEAQAEGQQPEAGHARSAKGLKMDDKMMQGQNSTNPQEKAAMSSEGHGEDHADAKGHADAEGSGHAEPEGKADDKGHGKAEATKDKYAKKSSAARNSGTLLVIALVALVR